MKRKSKKKNSNKILFAVIAAILLAIFAVIIVNNYKTKTSFKYSSQSNSALKPKQNPQDKVKAAINKNASKANVAKELAKSRKESKLLQISKEDFVLGDKSAPVTMIEYASLSCPHCAAFARESFDRIKDEYIDSGKVKFVFRNFPLNQSALVAAMFANCNASDNANNDKAQLIKKYFYTIKFIFKTQDSWAFDKNYRDRLKSIAKLDGMSEERFTQCIEDKSLQEKILTLRIDTAKELKLRSAPSFFINGEISEGYVDYKTLKKLIDKKLSQTK